MCFRCGLKYDSWKRIPVYHLNCKDCVCIYCWCEHLSENTTCPMCDQTINISQLYKARSQHYINDNFTYPTSPLPSEEYLIDEFTLVRMNKKNELYSFCPLHNLLLKYYDILFDKTYCISCMKKADKNNIISYFTFLSQKKESLLHVNKELEILIKNKVRSYFDSGIEWQTSVLLCIIGDLSENGLMKLLRLNLIDLQESERIKAKLKKLVKDMRELNKEVYDDFCYLKGITTKFKMVIKDDIKKIENIMDNMLYSPGKPIVPPYTLSHFNMAMLRDSFEVFYILRPYIVDLNQNLGVNMVNSICQIVWEETGNTDAIHNLLVSIEVEDLKIWGARYSWQWLDCEMYM